MDINIGFAINDSYAQHCACAIASVLANADQEDKYSFWIVYDFLTEENKTKIKKLKKIKDFDINFIKINKEDFSLISKNTQTNPSHFFKLKFFNLKEINKILYLDSDVIVRKDIGALYETDMVDSYMAAVKDIGCKTVKKRLNLSKSSIYINSGVMLIDLEKTREIDISQKIDDFLYIYSKNNYGDQDVINYIFQEKIKELDIRYNCMFPYHNEYDDWNYYVQVSQDPVIIHYIATGKPWAAGVQCHLRSDYFKYLRLTPYYDEFIDLYRIEENSKIFSMLSEIKSMLKGEKTD